MTRLQKRAFTLTELVLSMAIATILFGAIASAIFLTTRAIPSDDSARDRIAQAHAVAEQLAGELYCALWLRERTATAVAFTVPDRNADGVPERIRYAWSGTAGDPLTRQYNGGTAIDVLQDVREFNLAYDVETVTEQYPGPPVQSSEVTLASQTAAMDIKEYKIDTDKWPGQYFQPSGLPVDALTWSVTRVRFLARNEGSATESTWVQLRPPDASYKPTTTVLEQVAMPESSLTSSYDWKYFSFSNVSGLLPGTGLCLVLQHSGTGGPSAKVRYDNSLGSGLLYTSNSGSTWTHYTSRSLYYTVYGKYTTPGPPQTATRRYVTGVQVALRVGDDPATRVVTAAQTVNTPELLSGLWEAYFDSDPTLDHNGDGVADWAIRGGASFDTSSLVDGVWQIDQPNLDTGPGNSFTTLITTNVRMRSTGVGDSAVLWSNVDFSGGKFMPIIAQVQLQAGNTQVARVYTGWPLGSPRAEAIGLSTDFVTIRLLVDPTLNTVNIQVDGVDLATQSYTPYPPSGDLQSATLTLWGGKKAEFDYVSMRVSE